VNDRSRSRIDPDGRVLVRIPSADRAAIARHRARHEAAAVSDHRDAGEGPLGPAQGHRVRVILGEPPSPFRTSLVGDLARRPELEVVAVGTSAGMVRACASRQPDVALVADDLEPDGGVRTIERLVVAAPEVLVVLWTDTPDGEDALGAIRAGARGVLARDIGRDALTRSIRRVAAGEVALPRYLARAIVEELQGIERRSPGPVALSLLSSREQEVLALVGEGRQNREIATRLGISEFTVKRHVHNILGKLDVPSRAAAARLHGSACAVGANREPWPSERRSQRIRVG
jgi:DNA-binding NarL/FixJ family response regulator